MAYPISTNKLYCEEYTWYISVYLREIQVKNTSGSFYCNTSDCIFCAISCIIKYENDNQFQFVVNLKERYRAYGKNKNDG